MPKQSAKENTYLKMSDLVLYINKQYITGLKEIYFNDGALYFVRITFAPTKENMELLDKEDLDIKLSFGKKVIFEDNVTVVDIDLKSDEGNLIVILDTTVVNFSDVYGHRE